MKVDVTVFSLILEALKTDQDTLKRWDHLKRCICSVPALWELIHTSMLFTSQLIKPGSQEIWKVLEKNLKVDSLTEPLGLITVPT